MPTKQRHLTTLSFSAPTSKHAPRKECQAPHPPKMNFTSGRCSLITRRVHDNSLTRRYTFFLKNQSKAEWKNRSSLRFRILRISTQLLPTFCGVPSPKGSVCCLMFILCKLYICQRSGSDSGFYIVVNVLATSLEVFSTILKNMKKMT